MLSATRSFVFRRRILASRLCVGLGFALLLVSQSVHSFTLVGDMLTFAGLLLVPIAVVGRLWCAIYIGGYKNDELITVGPYSLTRNPLYFFSFIGFVGVACATQAFIFVAVVIGVFAIAYPTIIGGEENFLRDRFGKTFDAFCAATPRFFPTFKNYRSPETWTAYPRVFLRTARDVLWFVWLAAIVDLVVAIKQAYGFQPLFQVF